MPGMDHIDVLNLNLIINHWRYTKKTFRVEIQYITVEIYFTISNIVNWNSWISLYRKQCFLYISIL